MPVAVASLQNINTSLNSWLKTGLSPSRIIFQPPNNRTSMPTYSARHTLGATESRWQGDRVGVGADGAQIYGRAYMGIVEVTIWVSRKNKRKWMESMLEMEADLTALVSRTKRIAINDYANGAVRMFTDLPEYERKTIIISSFQEVSLDGLQNPDVEAQRYNIGYNTEIRSY